MTTELSTLKIKQHTNSLIIGTHNIQGMNDSIKFQQWIEFCNANSLDIISITETKLAQSKFTKHTLNNPYYQVFTSNTTIDNAQKCKASMGTAIAIKTFLQPYIHNITVYLTPEQLSQLISSYQTIIISGLSLFTFHLTTRYF